MLPSDNTECHAAIISVPLLRQLGPGEVKSLRRCATSRTVPGSIPGGVTWDFFRGSFRQNHVS